MTEPSSSAATIEWGQFAGSLVTVLNALALLARLKAAFPSLLSNLPSFIDKMTAVFADEVPRERLETFRTEALALAGAETKEMAPRFERFWLEMLVSRIADHFEFYLTQILSRILRQYPEALGTSQIQVRELLECRDLEDAIGRAVEKKVHELSFSGLSGIAGFLDKQLGAPIDTKSRHFAAVAELIEVRHLIVHNNGRVSRIFLARTSRTDLKVGDFFPLALHWVQNGLDSLGALVNELDRVLISHFKLARPTPERSENDT